MARAADGTMTLSGTFAVANTIPVSSVINGYINDILTEITDSWSRSGKGAALTNLSMGGFKLTVLGDGTVLTDAANIKQVQNSTIAWADGGGTADAITAAYSPAVTAVVDGMRLRVRATAANATTTPTFSPSALTARTIKKLNGQALVAGDIAGDEHDLLLIYVATGTYWNLLNPATLSASGTFTSLTVSQNVVYTGILTPAQLTADQNDYAPTGHATTSIFRLDANATRQITGLAGGADGRKIEIHNISTSQTILLVDQSASSTAGNRFITTDSGWVTLYPGGMAYLTYDGTASRWRASVGSTAAASAGSMETATSTNQFVTPGNQQRHPGHPKYWTYVTVSGGTPTAQVSYNLTSITDAGVGILTTTIATDFSSVNWAPFGALGTAAGNEIILNYNSIAAGTINFESNNRVSGNAEDPTSWAVGGLGDQ